jgi:hypothetical protein
MMAPPIPTTTPMTVLRVCGVMPEEPEVEDCGEAVPVARPVLVDVDEERRVLVTPLTTVTCVETMTDLDVKSEVVREIEWVEEVWLVGADVGVVIEESEVEVETGVGIEVVVDDAAADGVSEGTLVDEAAADGVGDGVVTTAVFDGEDDPPVPLNSPVTPVTCETMEETSSVKSFLSSCLASTFESSQLACATATAAKTTMVCRYSIVMVLMPKMLKEGWKTKWCAVVAPSSYSMK